MRLTCRSAIAHATAAVTWLAALGRLRLPRVPVADTDTRRASRRARRAAQGETGSVWDQRRHGIRLRRRTSTATSRCAYRHHHRGGSGAVRLPCTAGAAAAGGDAGCPSWGRGCGGSRQRGSGAPPAPGVIAPLARLRALGSLDEVFAQRFEHVQRAAAHGGAVVHHVGVRAPKEEVPHAARLRGAATVERAGEAGKDPRVSQAGPRVPPTATLLPANRLVIIFAVGRLLEGTGCLRLAAGGGTKPGRQRLRPVVLGRWRYSGGSSGRWTSPAGCLGTPPPTPTPASSRGPPVGGPRCVSCDCRRGDRTTRGTAAPWQLPRASCCRSQPYGRSAAPPSSTGRPPREPVWRSTCVSQFLSSSSVPAAVAPRQPKRPWARPLMW